MPRTKQNTKLLAEQLKAENESAARVFLAISFEKPEWKLARYRDFIKQYLVKTKPEMPLILAALAKALAKHIYSQYPDDPNVFVAVLGVVPGDVRGSEFEKLYVEEIRKVVKDQDDLHDILHDMTPIANDETRKWLEELEQEYDREAPLDPPEVA